MQQALFHGISTQRIANVNEKGKQDQQKNDQHSKSITTNHLLTGGEEEEGEYYEPAYDFVRKATATLHESDSQTRRGWWGCFGLFRGKKAKETLYEVDGLTTNERA